MIDMANNIYLGGITPQKLSQYQYNYEHKLISFKEFKRLVTEVLSAPIHWCHCCYIIDFYITSKFIFIEALNYTNNKVKVYLYH